MEENLVSYDNLPYTVGVILQEICELRKIVEVIQPPASSRHPIKVKEACQILDKRKATVYKLARNGIIPSCKRGRKVYFFEDELIA